MNKHRRPKLQVGATEEEQEEQEQKRIRILYNKVNCFWYL
jgi:hypothetical protein